MSDLSDSGCSSSSSPSAFTGGNPSIPPAFPLFAAAAILLAPVWGTTLNPFKPKPDIPLAILPTPPGAVRGAALAPVIPNPTSSVPLTDPFAFTDRLFLPEGFAIGVSTMGGVAMGTELALALALVSLGGLEVDVAIEVEDG